MATTASTTSTNGHPAPDRAANGHPASDRVVNGHPPVNPVPPGVISQQRETTIGDIARLLNAELVGDAETLITGVAGLDTAAPGTIAFIEHERLLDLPGSAASAIIVPASMAAYMRRAERKGGKPAVLTNNPRLAFAKVMEFMQPLIMPDKGIHPTAIIEPDAHIGEGVSIRQYCYVGHNAHIGDGVVLYPHVVIGDGAQIGNASVLFCSVVINHHVHVRERVRIHSGSVIGGDGFGYVLDEGKHHKMPQVGTVIIEDDVEIGANVCIDRATMGATRVGAGTKIDNLVQVAHNVQIGRNCILCGQVGLSGSVVIEDDVVLAGQIGARDHVKIGKGAIVGAQSGIICDIKPGEFVTGSPAVPNRDFFRVQVANRKLPEAMRSLRKLERQMEALTDELAELKKQNSANQT